MISIPCSDTGYWTTKNKNDYKFDDNLYIALSVFFKKRGFTTAFDLGCGNGDYCHAFSSIGVSTIGIDGNPNLLNFTKLGIIKDLSKPISLVKRECILSINVGEFIPKKYESIFINNLCSNTDSTIIIAWQTNKKIENQVNCLEFEYIVIEFQKRGFCLNYSDTYEIQNTSRRKDIYVFDKSSPNNLSRSSEKD